MARKKKQPVFTLEQKQIADAQIKESQKQIDYDTKDFTIELLISKFNKGDFFIPSYQRKFVWKEKNKNLLGNPFAQFVKFTTELRKTFTVGEDMKLATRVFGGIIYAYGNSSVAPYSEQFYIGGANSIRAFTVRSIGPGTYRPKEGNMYSYIDQTGDIKLEANVEFRFPILGDIHGALFLDAGNIWLLHDDEQRPGAKFTLSDFGKQIALGTGVGLRYDLDFLVFRLDLGVALHAPYETSKKGYYNIPKFADGLGLHFAIGYPF